ncbi:hypothetical protein [Butyricicoccus sp.]|uniref:hypothetical protein n=1 Tax=Butyricicoccus sp. TaxID=2049021 RepID=UPI003F1904D3
MDEINKKRKTHDIQAALLHSHRHVFLSKKEEEAPPDAGVLLAWKVGGLSGSFSLSIVVKLYHPTAKMKRSKIHELSTRSCEENCATSIYKKDVNLKPAKRMKIF